MNENPRLTLYHSPNTRSSAVRVLLEELGAPYELAVLDMTRGEQRDPAYLAVNPMGKVPALVHDGALVTELVASYVYLADLFPEAGLAPAIGDPLRGPYLRWLAFYGSCFEPAMMDRAMKREAGPRQSSPYGDCETVLSVLTGQLRQGPNLLGEPFTAADLLWGSALKHLIAFGLIENADPFAGYAGKVCARPAVARVAAWDAELAAAQGAPA